MATSVKTQYHISPKHGPMPCRARVQCKFGDVEHFDSEIAAYEAYAVMWQSDGSYMASVSKPAVVAEARMREEALEGHVIPEVAPELELHSTVSSDNPGLVALAGLEEATLKAAREEKRPLTDEEFERHVVFTEKLMASLVKSGKTTNQLHAIYYDAENYESVYSLPRVRQQESVLQEILKKYENVPSEGKAIFMGGLGGAGKSYILNNRAGIDESQYATLNPDDVKEIMARHGMIPHVDGLTPMEASPLVHEEACYITQVLLERLKRDKKNVIFDGTMSWQPAVEEQSAIIREAGYTEVGAIFVDIEIDTSFERAQKRHREGLNTYTEKDSGLGGRFLPRAVAERNAAQFGEHKSKSAESFSRLAKNKIFTTKPRVFNNNGLPEELHELDFFTFVSKKDS